MRAIAGCLPHFTSGPLSLCVLGAGNCNDLDLNQLSQWFHQITLADLDHQAMSDALVRQGLSGNSAFALRGPIDLSGTAGISDHDRVLGQLGGPFDVVVSDCLLTQMADDWQAAIAPAGNPATATSPRAETTQAAAQAIIEGRQAHLGQLIELSQPSGCSLLITDFVSSLTAPWIEQLQEDRMPAGLMARLIDEGNFFTGTNPAAIRAAVLADVRLAPRLASIQPLGPWPWHLANRVYLVYGLRFVQKPN